MHNRSDIYISIISTQTLVVMLGLLVAALVKIVKLLSSSHASVIMTATYMVTVVMI